MEQLFSGRNWLDTSHLKLRGCSKVIAFMKKYLASLVAVLLAGCSANILKPTEYSFELTDKILESKFEKEDDDGDYSKSCSRSGAIAYEIKVKPENFTGLVVAKIKDNVDYKEEVNYITVIDGKMLPMPFYDYSSTYDDDNEYFKRVCGVKAASDYKMEINKSTLLMVPGVHPEVSDTKKDPG